MSYNIAMLIQKVKDARRLVSFRGERAGVVSFAVQSALLLILGIVVIFFMKNTLVKRTAAIQEMYTGIEEQHQRIGAINQLKQGYQEVEGDIPKLEALLVYEDEVGAVITELDALLDHFALTGTTKISNKTEEPNGITYIPISVSMTSSIDTLQRYIRALEALPFLVKVHSIEFQGELNTSAQTLVHLNLYTH